MAHSHLGLLWLDATVPVIVWFSDKAPGNPFQVWSVTGEGLASSQFLLSHDCLGGELGWGGTCGCAFRDLTRHWVKQAYAGPFHLPTFVPALNFWNIDSGLLLETPFSSNFPKESHLPWSQTVETLWSLYAPS